MSEDHGPVTLKPFGEMAGYIKNFIPADIPEEYGLKSMFKTIADGAGVRLGVSAFRDFLHLLCDRLASDGDSYFKMPSKPKNVTDYPYLYGISTFLTDLGYYGALSESRDTLIVADVSQLTVKKADVIRFLALCGFVFNGIDIPLLAINAHQFDAISQAQKCSLDISAVYARSLCVGKQHVNAKTLKFSDADFLEVTYPGNPILLTGLKALSVSLVERNPQRRSSTDAQILQCDYRQLKADAPEIIDYLKEFLHPLPKDVQNFALELHRRYTDLGMTCVINSATQFEVRFSYAFVKNTKRALTPRDIYYLRVWEFSLTLRSGHCLVIRAKNTSQYADVIETFAPFLRQKIAGGYGCDRKLRNERCQCGCQGFRIPLDDSILGIRKDIETWLENESILHNLRVKSL